MENSKEINKIFEDSTEISLEDPNSTYIPLVQKKLDAARDPQGIALEHAVLQCLPNQVLQLLKKISSEDLYLILARKNGIMQQTEILAKSPTWAIKRRIARGLGGLAQISFAFANVLYFGQKNINLNTNILDISSRNSAWNALDCSSELSRCKPLGLCTVPQSPSSFAYTILTGGSSSILACNGLYQLYYVLRNHDGRADQKKYELIHFALQAKFNELALNYVVQRQQQ